MARRTTLAAVLTVLATLATIVPAAPAHASEPLVALGPVPTTAGLAQDLETLDAAQTYAAFVHFAGGRLVDHTRLIAGLGLDIAERYPQIGVYYVVGTVGDFRVLTWEPAVAYLEDDRELEHFGETAVWATGARIAQEPVAGGPYRDAASRVLDGAGVGVAVIDSGINAVHPDLASRVGKNIKIVCTTPGFINTTTQKCFGPASTIDMGTGSNTDSSSGHGTHVSGIIAGDGTASTGTYGGARPSVRGTFTGVAPGATLYGFGTGEGDSIFTNVEAMQYIYDNFNSFTPRIRVVNNSYGDPNGSAYNPLSVFNKLVNSLVNEKGVTIVFAAGNLAIGASRTGAADQTSSFSKNPTPGVISVANYDDAGTGARDNALNSSSSGGRAGAPETYPDVSAPGTLITSACIRQVQPICNAGYVDEARWAPYYASISGTSMAAPHVAGVAALLYQADPSIAPAEVEDLLQDTAHKFTAGGAYTPDPQNPGGTTSYDKGAGLVDVPAALDAKGVAHDDGGEDSAPAIHISEPGEGAELGGTGTITVSGTANDGTVPPAVPPVQLVFDGEAGDFDVAGAADVVALSAQETPAGTVVPGVTYRVTLRDATDLGPIEFAEIDLQQNVAGRSFTSVVVMDGDGVEPFATDGGTPTSASRSGNVVTFFVPFANLGNPPAGSVAHNVRVIAYIGTYMDVAPSPQDDRANASDADLRPMYGRAYAIARPEQPVPPTVTVTLSVDGGLPSGAAVSGISPDYTWTKGIDAGSLATGPHTLLATLFVNGLPAATHTSTFTIARNETYTYDVAVTNPTDGTTVPRAVVLVEGTSFTDDPNTARAVTLQVTAPLYDSGERAATGESPWVAEFDFSKLTAGPYTLTARLKVGGIVKATRAIGIVVPVSTEVECSPRNIDFWRGQYKRNSASLRFTDAEANQIAARAASLSSGYFASASKLITALNAGGSQPDKAAARQYATLLLNIAAGDLAGTMSYKAGLAGHEGLDPDVYATGVVGDTVQAAAAWMRAQLPDGNLGGVNEVGNAINNGQGLVC